MVSKLSWRMNEKTHTRSRAHRFGLFSVATYEINPYILLGRALVEVINNQSHPLNLKQL
ncbi:hypothetical protein JHK86_019982 [Glycine max]|nr:hypothetical protein JHK86_019982 [Glycine max]